MTSFMKSSHSVGLTIGCGAFSCASAHVADQISERLLNGPNEGRGWASVHIAGKMCLPLIIEVYSAWKEGIKLAQVSPQITPMYCISVLLCAGPMFAGSPNPYMPQGLSPMGMMMGMQDMGRPPMSPLMQQQSVLAGRAQGMSQRPRGPQIPSRSPLQDSLFQPLAQSPLQPGIAPMGSPFVNPASAQQRNPSRVSQACAVKSWHRLSCTHL